MKYDTWDRLGGVNRPCLCRLCGGRAADGNRLRIGFCGDCWASMSPDEKASYEFGEAELMDKDNG